MVFFSLWLSRTCDFQTTDVLVPHQREKHVGNKKTTSDRQGMYPDPNVGPGKSLYRHYSSGYLWVIIAKNNLKHGNDFDWKIRYGSQIPSEFGRTSLKFTNCPISIWIPWPKYMSAAISTALQKRLIGFRFRILGGKFRDFNHPK